MKRTELIEKLVLSSHLNVEERSRLRPMTVSLEELTSVIRRVLLDAGFFPSHARPVSEGDEIIGSIYEGLFIEARGDTFVVHDQGSGPHPGTFRGRSSRSFDSLRDAIAFLVANEYQGNIDGIPIVT